MKIKILISSLICLGLFSCLKDEFIQNSVTSDNVEAHSRDNNDIPYVESGPVILGEEIQNPYTVDIVNQANAILYGDDYVPVEATHQYIKFTPQNYDEVAILEEWTFNQSFVVFDFPLHYEFVQKGDFYIDPEVTDTLLNYQYASVPVEVIVPDVSHVILEEFFLDESNPFTFIQTYKMTGNGHRISRIVGDGIPEETVNTYMPGPTLPCITNYPPPPCPDHCNLVFFLEEISPDVFDCWWECHCPNEGGGTVDPPRNACGCLVPTNPNIPAGCIQVDFDGADEPVRIVRVEVWDWTFLSKRSDVVFTDRQGCWEVAREYNEHDMRVKFENGNLKVRDHGYFIGSTVIRDNRGQFTTPPYNNNYVFYTRANDSQHWAGSHTHNGDLRYRDLATLHGFTAPRTRINYLNSSLPLGGGAAAPMLQDIDFSAANSLFSFMGIPNFPPPGLPTFGAFGKQPDIVLQYPEGTTAAGLIDVQTHELGHASHYVTAGESLWHPLRTHVILNLGDGGFPNFHPASSPEINALAESVAEYMEERFGTVTNGDLSNLWRSEYIPMGFLLDLEDPIRLFDITTTQVDPPFLSTADILEGFTPAMFYDVLDPSVRSIRQFRDRLAADHLPNTPNNLIDFNTVVDVYDVFN